VEDEQNMEATGHYCITWLVDSHIIIFWFAAQESGKTFARHCAA